MLGPLLPWENISYVLVEIPQEQTLRESLGSSHCIGRKVALQKIGLEGGRKRWQTFSLCITNCFTCYRLYFVDLKISIKEKVSKLKEKILKITCQTFLSDLSLEPSQHYLNTLTAPSLLQFFFWLLFFFPLFFPDATIFWPINKRQILLPHINCT